MKKNIALSISLTLFLISFTHFTIIFNIPDNVLAQTPTSSANETYHFVKEWGSNGTGDGQFSGPAGIAVDSSDNVYVGDYIDDRIQKFDSDGSYITKWGSNGIGNGELYSPNGISVDSSDNVYVGDTLERIQVFAQNNNNSLDNDGNKELTSAGITDQV